jgi:hypothetical protein
MRNSITNPMAKMFGSEYNLSVNEIADCIERIYRLDVWDSNISYKEVEVALYNDDYYVRPGESKRAFNQAWMKLFVEAKASGENDLASFAFAIKLINLIKDFFDEAYFREQIARREVSTGDKIKLKTYISKFNKIQLLQFMSATSISKSKRGMFISEASYAALFKEIDDECRKHGANIPMALDSPEGQEFLRQHPFYYFEILSAKTISNFLSDAIDLDVPLATTLARKFCNCGYEAMLNCLNENLNLNVTPIYVRLAK